MSKSGTKLLFAKIRFSGVTTYGLQLQRAGGWTL